MSLSKSKIIGFVPSVNLDAAASFYTDKLGLELVRSDEYALEYVLNETTLRITKVSEVARASYTTLGWEVDDIYLTVKGLNKKGIELIFYDGMPQDTNGVCSFPNGGKVAWFKDTDENILSIAQV